MKIQAWKRWAPALLFLTAVVFTALLLRGYTRPAEEEQYLTPLLTDLSGWELCRMEDGRTVPLTPAELMNSSETACLTRTLDPEWEARGYTFLKLEAAPGQTEVFLEGELLCRAVLEEYGEPLRVTLPGHWGGKTLTLVFQREHWDGMPMVILSGGAVEQGAHVAAANRIGMPAAAFAVAALVLLGLFLFGGWQGTWDWPLLLLTLAAFVQTFYWLREYSMTFSADFAFNVPLAAFFPHFFVLLPQLYLAVRMAPRRRVICLAAVGACGLISLFSVFLSALPVAEWCMAALYGGTAAVLVLGVAEVKSGSRVFRVFFCGTGLLLGAYVICLAVSLLGDGSFAGNAATVFSSALRGSHTLLLRGIGVASFLLCALLAGMETIWRAAERRAEMELLTARNEQTAENLRILQERGQEIAKVRHDVLGHLGVLQILLRGQKYDRMEAYLEQLTRQAEDIVPMKLTDHPVVNAILLRYAQRARDAGVRFDCHVELPETLSVPDSDLSSFLTNLLDNALEAAGEGEGGWMEVTIHIRGKYLFMECRNSYSGEPDRDETTGLYRSCRGVGHGYGMRIMEDVAHRYRSGLQVEGKDGVFLARTALLMG